MVRVLLGQRGTLLCGALAAVLSAQPDLRVVAELCRADGVAAAATRERAQVAVLDGRLPGTATVGELCRALRRTLPGCRPLVLLDRGAGADLGRSLVSLAPWLGLLATDAAIGDLVGAVRQLARGGRVLDPGLAAAARAGRENPLTERERDVLRLTRSGAPPKETARKLDLSVGTIRNHLSRGVAKIGARTRLEAIRTAHDAGWL